MLKQVLIVAFAASLAAVYFSAETQVSAESQFMEFVSEYRRSYFSKEEYNYRLGVFKTFLKTVEERNNNEDGVVHGITKFADWTQQEFEALLNLPERQPEPEITYSGLKAPKGECDWTNEKKHPTKDQGSCGSCWAFAATAQLEFGETISKDDDVDLSEQELVDCAKGSYSNNGCNGGWYDWAWNYVADKGGLSLQQKYKYRANDGDCEQVDDKNRRIPIKSGHTNMGNNANIDAIKLKVDEFPLAVAVYASGWSSYSSGVFKCGFYFQVNHAVTLVGYGTDSDGTQYWIIRNSWGNRWGKNGQMWLHQTQTAQSDCGLRNYVKYADLI